MESNACIKSMISNFLMAENKDAFSMYDGTNVTNISYSQFAEDILTVAGYFQKNHIRKQHVALATHNGYHGILMLFAVVATGNVAVPLNFEQSMDVLQWQINKAEISLIYYDGAEGIVMPEGTPSVSFAETYKADPISLDSVYVHDEEETLLMLCTSGTTGTSKIVEISSKNLEYSLTCHASAAELDGMERALLPLPLFHIGGIYSVLCFLIRTSTVCFGRGIRYAFVDIPILKPTYTPLVPAMMESLAKMYKMQSPDVCSEKLGGSLRRICVAAAASNAATCRFLMEQGYVLETAYAMTESVGVGTWCEWTADTIGSIGKPCEGMQCKIEDGEILLKSKGIMKGYYKDPEETAKVIVDGWLHTGDMGYCDENGYYYITGRKKNVIILSNGENVNPEEIEATFGDCETIEECLVYSDGKGICADVYTFDPKATASFIKKYNEGSPMSRHVYKVYYFDQPLPKTSSGKIKRKENK